MKSDLYRCDVCKKTAETPFKRLTTQLPNGWVEVSMGPEPEHACGRTCAKALLELMLERGQLDGSFIVVHKQ